MTYDFFELGAKWKQMGSIPDAPEGWNDPIEWTFIGRFVRDTDNNKLFFKDFEEAVAAANDIDECRGITLTEYGYSLRKGKVRSDPTLVGRASWTKMISQEE